MFEHYGLASRQLAIKRVVSSKNLPQNMYVEEVPFLIQVLCHHSFVSRNCG